MKRRTFVLSFCAAIVCGSFCAISVFAGGKLTLKGSDTCVNMGQALAEAFMNSDAGQGIDVHVTGGGSGVGIAQFINGQCDIAQSSRPISPKEKQQAKDRNRPANEIRVAMDGLSVAVNEANPVKKFTMAQLKAIFTGKITDWKDVGGRPGRIVVLSRETSSGTHVFFKETVLNNQNFAPGILLMTSTKAIAQEIANNPNAIGYGGVAYFKNKRGVDICRVNDVEPSDENVRSMKYPISRYLYWYTAGKPKGDAAKLVAFALSPQGQQIVERVGFVSLRK